MDGRHAASCEALVIGDLIRPGRVVGVLFAAVVLSAFQPPDAVAMQPSPAKSWTEKELYEARNWMPSASDSQPDDQMVRAGSRVVPSLGQASRRRTIKRVNLAEYKARLAAKIGIARLAKPGRPATSIAPRGLRHVGAHLGLGGGFLEGAGFSARSPREALAACSYSQSGYPVLYQGVARGRDGYFAYKIYRR